MSLPLKLIKDFFQAAVPCNESDVILYIKEWWRYSKYHYDLVISIDECSLLMEHTNAWSNNIRNLYTIQYWKINQMVWQQFPLIDYIEIPVSRLLFFLQSNLQYQYWFKFSVSTNPLNPNAILTWSAYVPLMTKILNIARMYVNTRYIRCFRKLNAMSLWDYVHSFQTLNIYIGPLEKVFKLFPIFIPCTS